MPRKSLRAGLLLLFSLSLAGCAVLGPSALQQLRSPDSGGQELAGTPFFPQQRYQCGPAALAMALGASGVDISPEELVPKVYLPERQGSLQTELIAATRGYQRLPYVIEPSLSALLAELDAGRPVLVLENLGLSSLPLWHYAVVVGYLPDRDELLLRSGTTKRLLRDAGAFLDDWGKADNWAMVVLRPSELPASHDPGPYLKTVVALESAGYTQSARTAYAAATRRWPDNPVAWLGMGNTAYSLNQKADALRAYRELLRIDPGSVVGKNNLAQVLAELGCREAALALLAEALKSAQDSDPLRASLQRTREEIQAMPESTKVECMASGQVHRRAFQASLAATGL